MKNLYLTKYQEVLKEIENIWYAYTVDQSGSYDTLTNNETRELYLKLQSDLNKFPGLTEEERKELNEIIDKKLKKVPERKNEIDFSKVKVIFDDDLNKKMKMIFDDDFNRTKKKYTKHSAFNKFITSFINRTNRGKGNEK